MKNNKALIRTSEGFETIDLSEITKLIDLAKIGNKHMKPYFYIRESDFTHLSDTDLKNMD